MTRPKLKKTSQIIQETIDFCNSEGDVAVGEFLKLLGDRAFYIAILIFSLPNSLPIPGIPGFSTITGLPITFIALQLMVGRETIWLPHSIADKTFRKQSLGKMLKKALPSVIWLEKLLSPRWTLLTEGFSERVIGLMFVILSGVIALPIPGGNFLPGISMSLIALSMLEKDGRALTLSLIFAIASLTFMVEVITTFFKWMAKAVSSLF